jgi:molecular chaperone GrpE
MPDSLEVEKEETNAEDHQDEQVCATEEEANETEVVDEVAEEEKDEEVDYKEKFYYLAAEMDNMKRRADREKESLLKYGNERVLSSLVEVVDNLERTLDAINNDEDEKVKNIYVGIDMVRNQFMDVLKSNGMTEVESLGEIFDPKFHEAMTQQPAEGKKDDEIISVFQKGYTLNGRLLRAAKVVIAKN